ncbi:MAG: nucleotidyltransferase domain-containing protein [Balneolales bacterium]|nr:nucleotidyltransferase domain-containing protein [Balneolales bacterium]
MKSHNFENLYNEIIDLYASDVGVLGCYVSGSASYGGMTDESDVDFYVLTTDYHGFLERIHGARRVEIRWRTYDEISLDISRGGPFIYQLMDAAPVRDPAGNVQELMAEARERYEGFSHSVTTIKDVHFRIGEARMKLRSAIRSEDKPKQAYLCAIYTTLLLEALFVMLDKPVATGTTAWRWLHKLPGLTSEGLTHTTHMLQLPLEERAPMMEAYLNQLHGSLTAKLKR